MPSKNASTGRQSRTTRTILFVAYPGMKLLDLAGPLQAFTDVVGDDGKPVYRTVVASCDGGAVQSDTPVALSTEALHGWRRRRIDTLIVVGGKGTHAACKDARLIECIVQLAGRSRRTGSICNGAFLLAACGLLDDRRATTHWESCSELATAYPSVLVEPDPIYIRDGSIWTSAGVTAGLDMAIAMIADDLGRTVALSLARALLAYLVRPGGQSQFSEALDQQLADGVGRFDTLHEWMRDHLHHDLGVEHLAGRANMSMRNFARTYLAQTGRTPAKAVEAMRVEAARRLLESGNATLQVIASRCGFGDDERMRRAFLRQLNVPPSDYRSRFR